MNFYYVDENYTNYLRAFEAKIPNFNYGQARKSKFVCGVVLEIADFFYYAPVSSNTTVYKTSFPILDMSDNRVISTLRLSYMFPVPKSALTIVDFSQFQTQDLNYYNLIKKERDYCIHNATQIKNKAMQVYKIGTNPKHFLSKNCCDFKLLEEKFTEYCKMNDIIV